jgi:YidC/Oxa1 family membrane protein insertase
MFITSDNRTLNTKDFEPNLTEVGSDQVLTMRLKAGANEYLEYKYVLKADDYMLDFDIQSQGLSKVLNTSKPLSLEWNLKTYTNEKSTSYGYSELYLSIRMEKRLFRTRY